MTQYYSHVGQDRWVAEVYRGLRGGYFVDFGAFDGVLTSNTYFLEKALSWTGICVEPNPHYFPSVCANRSCIAINNALWPISRLSLELYNAHGLSRLTSFEPEKSVADRAQAMMAGVVAVDTINPIELLDRFNAPSDIHYLSMDIEGAEVAVLESMDFYRYHFGLVSIEHNHDQNKIDAIRHIMRFHGYEVCALRNDDLFYNIAVVHGLSGGRCEDPAHVRERVLNSYIVDADT